jgi:hypothetical protein
VTEDEMLDKLLRADMPPSRDPLFRIAVLARRERRLFQRQVVGIVAIGAAATVLVAVYAAAISTWFAADSTRVAYVLAVAAAVAWTVPGASRLVPSPLSNLVRTVFARVTQMVFP